MRSCFPDVQSSDPQIPAHLTRVGISGIKKLVKIPRSEGRPIILVSTFNLFVDLPAHQKGIHMSRSHEVLQEVLEELEKSVEESDTMIEDLCSRISRKLLERHDYATRSEVHMTGELILPRKTPATGLPTQEPYKIIGRSVSRRTEEGIETRKMVGAEVVGLTACPCALEMIREYSQERVQRRLVKELGLGEEEAEELARKIMKKDVFPMTHNQRGVGTVMIEVPDAYSVNIKDIIRIIEESMSAPTYELLKRPDELEVTKRACRNPKFVEDCVREMIRRIVDEFDHLPDDALVIVRQVNHESIHKHNAFAERVTTMGELRRELGS
ncbi:MAG: GTP cyclohydrolase MptA [Euryarchaeota archaeon]